MKTAASLAMCLLMLSVATVQAQEPVSKSTAMLRESMARNGGDGGRMTEDTKLVHPHLESTAVWFKPETGPFGRLEKERSESEQMREAAGDFGSAVYNLAGKAAKYIDTHRWQSLLMIVAIVWLQGLLRRGLSGTPTRGGN